MKTLLNPKALLSADGKTVTLTCDVAELPYGSQLTRKVSHGYLHPENIKHQRGIIATSDVVLVESRYGKAAITNAVLAALGAAVEPKTSFAPVFKKGSSPAGVDVLSETPFTLQWETTDKPNPIPQTHGKPMVQPIWTPIKDATGPKIDESSIPVGLWVRCVATNSTGSTASQPAQRK